MLPGVKRWLGQTWLRLHGWRLEGAVPQPQRFVLLLVPHTSNWDAVYMLAMGFVYGIRIEWMVKDTLFVPPMGWLLRALGGIPIDRRASNGVVGQMIEAFARRDSLILGIPPEGTRTRGEYWKSGFYEIARAAKVPIVLGYLDFGRKVGGMGPTLIPTGDVVADMDRIRAFYEGMNGLHPGEFTPPKLKLEEPK